MSSVPWCDSVDAKLDRARQHYNAIDKGINEFIDSTRNRFVPKVNFETNEAWLVWWTEGPAHPDISLSILIGELLYNLRSSLDNLVCALARKRSQSWATSCDGLGFPIYIDGHKFNSAAPRLLNGIDPSARTLIQGLQPYCRGANGADVDPLNILNVLRNRDTHRALNLAIGYHKNTRFVISDSVTKVPLVYAANPERLFVWNDVQTIPFPVPAQALPQAIDVSTTSDRGVMFREEGPWADRPVQDVLLTCLEYVEERVVSRFKPFFSDAPKP